MKDKGSLVISQIWLVGGFVIGMIGKSMIQSYIMYFFAIVWMIIYFFEK